MVYVCGMCGEDNDELSAKSVVSPSSIVLRSISFYVILLIVVSHGGFNMTGFSAMIFRWIHRCPVHSFPASFLIILFLPSLVRNSKRWILSLQTTQTEMSIMDKIMGRPIHSRVEEQKWTSLETFKINQSLLSCS